jgi:hypothetical protein
MKFDVLCIIKDHFETLRDARNGRFSIFDFFAFFLVPMIVSLVGFLYGFSVKDPVETSLIAVFSVFAALLFSAQIALYGVFSKGIEASDDQIEEARNALKRQGRQRFFSEVNANVSYLILFSVLSLVWLLCALLIDSHEGIEDAVTLGITVHFIVTLLMLIKRVHIAFSATYMQ